MRIESKYKGIKGFIKIYRYGLRLRYMITEKAKYKTKVLTFWGKYGLYATIEAFNVKRSTLFLWKKKLKEGGGKLESLNDKSKVPQNKRKRNWSEEIIKEIKRIRNVYPNLGKDKINTILNNFCKEKNLKSPKSSTIGRIIKDNGGLRLFPQKISHFGKIKKRNRQKVIRKPKDFKSEYAGHLVALDTIEIFVSGIKRYVITFKDIYTRFTFAWSTNSHGSKAAQEFFDNCVKVFPYPIKNVLTDNGSEFKKHFNARLKELYLIHFHTYPKTPKMNAHCERFNRTIQEEFIDYNKQSLVNQIEFNKKLMTWLIWYNAERPHYAFQNKLSPLQFMIQSDKQHPNYSQKSNIGWTYTNVSYF